MGDGQWLVHNSTICELGAGGGATAINMIKKWPNKQITTIDLVNSDHYSLFKRYLEDNPAGNLTVIDGDYTRLMGLPGYKFDEIIAIAQGGGSRETDAILAAIKGSNPGGRVLHGSIDPLYSPRSKDIREWIYKEAKQQNLILKSDPIFYGSNDMAIFWKDSI